MRTIDIIGVIEDVSNISSINLKSGQTKDRRNVTLVDNSGDAGCSITATLWSDNAQLNNYRVGQVMAIKGARISDYNGKSLNCGQEHS